MILDHAFILVRPWRHGQGAAEAADELAASLEAIGFRQGSHRRHVGQGTENRCFRLDGFMLELLFVVSRDEAGSETSSPLSLLARLDDPAASPFGIASRSPSGESPKPDYPSTPYHPAYLPPTLPIALAADVPSEEPLWFHLPFVMPDDARPEPVAHPNGATRLASVTLVSPSPLGERSASIAAALDIGTARGAHRLVLRLEGDPPDERLVEPHARLPLSFEGRRTP